MHAAGRQLPGKRLLPMTLQVCERGSKEAGLQRRCAWLSAIRHWPHCSCGRRSSRSESGSACSTRPRRGSRGHKLGRRWQTSCDLARGAAFCLGRWHPAALGGSSAPCAALRSARRGVSCCGARRSAGRRRRALSSSHGALCSRSTRRCFTACIRSSAIKLDALARFAIALAAQALHLKCGAARLVCAVEGGHELELGALLEVVRAGAASSRGQAAAAGAGRTRYAQRMQRVVMHEEQRPTRLHQAFVGGSAPCGRSARFGRPSSARGWRHGCVSTRRWQH